VLILGVENAIFEIQEHEKEKKKGKEKITIPERNSNRYFLSYVCDHLKQCILTPQAHFHKEASRKKDFWEKQKSHVM
jgi:hypothetical protein